MFWTMWAWKDEQNLGLYFPGNWAVWEDEHHLI